MLKPFFSCVSEDRYHILSYQILHGMINDFLDSFNIGRERRKERQNSVYFDCPFDYCSRVAES